MKTILQQDIHHCPAFYQKSYVGDIFFIRTNLKFYQQLHNGFMGSYGNKNIRNEENNMTRNKKDNW
jgi:hypothetical protein